MLIGRICYKRSGLSACVALREGPMNCARCHESLNPEAQVINFASDEYKVCGSCLNELRDFMKNVEKPVPVSTNTL